MSKDHPESSDPQEIGRIRKMAELLREYDLNEIDLQESGRRIRIKRGLPPVMAASAAPAPAVPRGTATSAPAAAAQEDDSKTAVIKCPMVGSFYSRPKPDQPSYVKLGDMVTPETIVCIVEAMKMFNEIPAGISGKIVEVCVRDGEPVDVNKPLFKVAI